MAQIDISVGERRFAVSCQDGEEDQLRKLAALVDEKARMTPQFNGLTESRMLLFAALLLADELDMMRDGAPIQPDTAPSPPPEPAPTAPAIDEGTVKALEKLAERAEAIAAGLEETAASS